MPRAPILWYEVKVDEDGVVTKGKSPFDIREQDNEVWVTLDVNGERHVEHAFYVWRFGEGEMTMGLYFVGVDHPEDIVAWAFNNPPPPYKGEK